MKDSFHAARNPKNCRFISICAAIAALAFSAHAADLLDISLTNLSLPTAQGWTYDTVNSSLSETQAFSTDGTILRMNTLGQGYQSQGRNVYVHTITNFVPGGDWILDFRIRVPQFESMYSDPTYNASGFGIGVSFDGIGVWVGLTGAIRFWLEDGTTPTALVLFDTSDWHDYRFVTDRAHRTYYFFIDNILKSSGPLATSTNSHFMFGDGTGGQNARAEIASLHLFQRGVGQGTTVPADIYHAVEVAWSTTVGRTYQVQSTPSLTNPNWSDFGLPFTGDGLPKSVFDTTRDATNRFYRVIQVE